MHGLWVWLGLTNGGGKAYLWWSGFGANFGEYVLLGGLYTLYRRHNCHVRRCWRVQRHAVEGTPYITCRKHHPDVPNQAPSAQDVSNASSRAAYDRDDVLRQRLSDKLPTPGEGTGRIS